MEFTQKECSEMFRKGTLHGKEIERSKFESLHLPGNQLNRCFVIVDGIKYKLCQYYNYEANKKEIEQCTNGIPDVIVNYVITEILE